MVVCGYGEVSNLYHVAVKTFIMKDADGWGIIAFRMKMFKQHEIYQSHCVCVKQSVFLVRMKLCLTFCVISLLLLQLMQ